jgi:hypothetical protein
MLLKNHFQIYFNMPYLKRDTYSAFRPDHLYGRSGDPIMIIKDRDGILIVKTNDGQKFPLLPKDITDVPKKCIGAPKRSIEDKLEEKKAPAIRRQKRPESYAGSGSPAGSGQSSLFG